MSANRSLRGMEIDLDDREQGARAHHEAGSGRSLPEEVLRPLVIHSSPTSPIGRIAMVGNHLPRQCGIATFTTDLSDALSAASPALDCFVLAMNDAARRHAYPPKVQFEITASDVASYRGAADYLNASPVDLVSVQHEYGIFGGAAGSHLFALLRDLRVPIVTTLHTILAAPNPEQRIAMDELLRLSERVVVMSAHGKSLLEEVHGLSPDKIDLIPHGIPTLPGARQSKEALGLSGKSVILTFGLLSPDKGIESVIDSLPAILARHPDTVYIVLGATHPHVLARDGERYREQLAARALELGVSASVIFHDRFVAQEELNGFLAAADIYITPYLNPEQITSGTLAYAVGSGKAVISTPYSYARELLSCGRGILVPWPREDRGAIAREVIGLLSQDEKSESMRARALSFGRDMRWPTVARAYLSSFERARVAYRERQRAIAGARTHSVQPLALPALNLDHLNLLTDDTGILQHAVFSVPRYDDGYCLDDNARALLVMARLGTNSSGRLASRYLAFVHHAFDAPSGRFRNFMSYARHFREEPGSEDCHGRALWALGAVALCGGESGQRRLASSLFHDALPMVERLSSPRAWAYALLGIDEYLKAFPNEGRATHTRRILADRLLALYQRTSTPAWPWFEERATYCNARLCEALLVSGAALGDDDMKTAGLRSLEWLCDVQRSPSAEGCFAPIGSNGFYPRGGARASFDQQPVEVCAMVAACLAAARVTGDSRWPVEARRAFQWFLGQNQLHHSLYDPATGACRDGLHPDRPNENQGAESTLSFLLSLLDMRLATS